MLELWQAEWCPYSHRVRLRLTELRVDWIARTIPLDRAERDTLEVATGIRSIPTLVDGGTVVHGADAIIAHLDANHARADRRITPPRADARGVAALDGTRGWPDLGKRRSAVAGESLDDAEPEAHDERVVVDRDRGSPSSDTISGLVKKRT